MSHNKELAQIFDHMADLYLLGGKPEDRYRISSYRRVAQTLKYLQKDVAETDKEGKLEEIPGIGPAISEKIHEYLASGEIKTYEKLKGGFPESLLALMDVPSLGPKKVQMLWKKLKITNKDQLLKAIASGKIEKLEGFGKKSVENIKQGLEISETLQKRKLLGVMFPVVELFLDYLEKPKLAEKLSPAGSFRRREETIGDLDFLAVSKKPQDLIHYFAKHPAAKKVLAEGDTKGSIILENDLQVDLRVVKADEWGAALAYFKGCKAHNIRLRTMAKEKGMLVNEYGVYRTRKRGNTTTSLSAGEEIKKKIAGKTEEEVYEK